MYKKEESKKKCIHNLRGSCSEGCRDCSITIDGPITTGTAEVINSHSINVHINHRVPTLQVSTDGMPACTNCADCKISFPSQIDGCNGCGLFLRERRSMHALYTAKTSNMSIILVVESEGETKHIPYELDFSDGE